MLWNASARIPVLQDKVAPGPRDISVLSGKEERVKIPWVHPSPPYTRKRREGNNSPAPS